MEVRRGATIRVLSTWGKRLEAVGLWYDQLLAESLGKNGQGATPLTVVNTRDLHSRGQQHQEGRRDKLITNLVVERPRRASRSRSSNRSSTRTSSTSWPARRCRTCCRRPCRAPTRPMPTTTARTADIRLPRLDEASLGQLFQMLMVATVVEGRLIGHQSLRPARRRGV